MEYLHPTIDAFQNIFYKFILYTSYVPNQFYNNACTYQKTLPNSSRLTSRASSIIMFNAFSLETKIYLDFINKSLQQHF